jgi:hypothetical protein
MVVIIVCRSSFDWLLVCCVGERGLWLIASVRVIVILAWLVFFVKNGSSTSVPVIVSLVVSLLCWGRRRLALCQCAGHSYLG